MNKIGIIGAMELEVEELKAAMTVSKIEKRANMDFYEGTLCGTPVVIVRSGVGKVNAALCTQILADVFEVSHIINTGVAGSLNPKLDIGDILISREPCTMMWMSPSSAISRVKYPSWACGNFRRMSGLQDWQRKPVKKSIPTFMHV